MDHKNFSYRLSTYEQPTANARATHPAEASHQTNKEMPRLIVTSLKYKNTQINNYENLSRNLRLLSAR